MNKYYQRLFSGLYIRNYKTFPNTELINNLTIFLRSGEVHSYSNVSNLYCHDGLITFYSDGFNNGYPIEIIEWYGTTKELRLTEDTITDQSDYRTGLKIDINLEGLL